MNKKILICVTMFLTAVSALTGCQDRLQREFQDPEKLPNPEATAPGMLTQMLNTRFFILDYGEWYYAFNGGLGLVGYTQVALRRPSPSESSYYDDWWQNLDGGGYFTPSSNPINRFNQYYTDLKNWGLLRDEISGLTGERLANSEAFLLAATVIKDVVGLQTVDVFNKIPYSEAFLGSQAIFFPKYDDAKEIYTTILDELGELTTTLPAAYENMSDAAKSSFAKSDIAFGGDTKKWVQYINSARLRHAVRMSGVDEAFAKKHIESAIKDLPTSDFLFPNTQRNQNRVAVNGGGGGIYSRAIFEQAYSTLIPNIIMQRMNHGEVTYTEGEDDPRLPVISTPTRYRKETQDVYQFVGVSGDFESQYLYWPTQSAPSGSYVDNGPGLTFRQYSVRPTDMTLWLSNEYAHYNAGTFEFGNIPAYMASRAENDLFLAEVAAKNLASTGKSAAEHVRDAVVHSTDMWYYINGLSTCWAIEGMPPQDAFLTKALQPAKPSSAAIETYADKVKSIFEAASGIEDQMEVIMQQKYIHHNILNVYELWAELRRTRHPKLEKMKAGKENLGPWDPILERLKYPTSELQNNMDNYNAVQNESTFTPPFSGCRTARRVKNTTWKAIFH